MSEIAIKVENLSKKYIIGGNQHSTLRDTLSNLFRRSKKEEFWALKDINFEIKKGEAVGIIGPNGAGKSTLLKILSKITHPTTGRVEMNGRVSSLLEVGTGFHPELTGRENIFLNGSLLGMTRSEIKSKFDKIVDFSGVERFIDTPVKHYSSGMYVRLAFSVAAHLNTEILLLDEVLAVGDSMFQKKCLEKIKSISKQGKTILLVSHNLNSILKFTKSSILLEHGEFKLKSSSSVIVNQYLEKEVSEFQEFSTDNLTYSIGVEYEDDYLSIVSNYEFRKDVVIPHLGIGITNQRGEKLYNINPSRLGLKIERSYSRIGEICIKIREPKLRPGKYYVSVWFGDGNSDFHVKEDALGFEINGFYSSNLGSVIPSCEYTIADR